MSRRAALGWGITAAAATTGLGSCARGTETRPAPGDVVTLVNDVATWSPGFQAAGSVLRRLTGYRIAPRSVPNVSNYQQIVRMSAQTDSTSDLLKWWNGYRLRDVARAGILADVTSAWDRAAAQGWCDDRELRDSFSYDGRQYGVPLYKSYYVVFYAKQTFARLGVDVPETWADFLAVVDAAKNKGITPIASSGAGGWESLIWFQQLVNGLDHDFYVRLGNGRAKYTDNVCVEAMRLWVNLYARKAFSASDLSSADVPGLFGGGKLAMQLHATWNTGTFVTAGLNDRRLGAFLLPAPPGGQPSVVIESAVLAVTAKAHKLRPALSVARSWLDPAVQKAFAGFLKDTSADPSVVPNVGPIRDVAAALAKVRPTQAIRYWEASPPAPVEGNVQDLSAFMTAPTRANAMRTLQSMQRRADKEWQVWNS